MDTAQLAIANASRMARRVATQCRKPGPHVGSHTYHLQSETLSGKASLAPGSRQTHRQNVASRACVGGVDLQNISTQSLKSKAVLETHIVSPDDRLENMGRTGHLVRARPCAHNVQGFLGLSQKVCTHPFKRFESQRVNSSATR